jgi:predicted NBD/HSP70 family sugar kinase
MKRMKNGIRGGNGRRSDNLVAGIDIGGTKVRWAIVHIGAKNFRVSGAHETATPKDKAALERLLCNVFAALARRGVRSVGVSVAGHFNAVQRVVTAAHNTPALKGVSLVRLAGKTMSVRTDNDARCFARTELRYGRIQRSPTVLVIILGTGIGRALIKNGTVVQNKYSDYAEPWEKEYRQRVKRPAKEIAHFLAPHFVVLAHKVGARAIILGGGRFRTQELFSALKQELFRIGFRGSVTRSHYRQNAAVIGATLLCWPTASNS